MDSGAIAWMLTATALAMLMTPGLAFFYGGLVRAKNVVNTIMYCFIAVAVVSVVWGLWGYSLAFGDGKIFVSPIADVVRVSSGERGEIAI
jgi:Amt family ammonium transporter